MIFRGVQTLTGGRILLLYYSTFVLNWGGKGTAVPDRDRNRMVYLDVEAEGRGQKGADGIRIFSPSL